MPQFRVSLFAMFRELLHEDSIGIECEARSHALRAELERRHPILRDTAYAIAVDLRIVHEDVALSETSQIALLPPFSGG